MERMQDSLDAARHLPLLMDEPMLEALRAEVARGGGGGGRGMGGNNDMLVISLLQVCVFERVGV